MEQCAVFNGNESLCEDNGCYFCGSICQPFFCPFEQAIIINFSIPVTSIAQGSNVQFDVQIKNIGNQTTNVSTQVWVVNSLQNVVAIVNSTNVSIDVGENKTISTFLSTASLSLGNYNATALVFYDDGKTTSNLTRPFTVVSGGCTGSNCCIGNCCSGNCPPPPPPPPAIAVEFEKWETLHEIVVGQSTVIGVTVKNIMNTTISSVGINITGIDPSWFTVVPTTLTNITPGGEKTFNIGISVPSNTPYGDYLVSIKISNDTNFFILRARTSLSSVSEPTVTRIVEIDRDSGKVNVNLTFANDKAAYPEIQMIESVGKEVGNNTDLIDFNDQPTLILKKDPLFEWDFSNVQPYQIISVSYSINNLLTDYTQYIYWPLQELNLITERIPKGVLLVSLDVPIAFHPGKSSRVSFTLNNIDNISYNITATININNWKTSPDILSATIENQTTQTYGIDVSVPAGTSYIIFPGKVSIDVSLNGNLIRTISSDFFASVQQEIISYELLLWLAIAAIIIVVAVLIYQLRRSRVAVEYYKTYYKGR